MSLMRRFSIRLRMTGAIAVVLSLFALVGAAGLLGGSHLSALNQEFTEHSIKEVQNISDIRAALGELRRREKDLLLNHAQADKVPALQQQWQQAQQRVKAGLQSLLEGEEDEDNPLARSALQSLQAYAEAAAPTMAQVAQGQLKSPVAGDTALRAAKDHIHRLEQELAKVKTVVDAEAEHTQAAFDAELQRTLIAFVSVLTLVVVVVVPLTLMNSRSIIAPIQHAREVALAIAEGDLTRPVDTAGQDEASELLHALVHMQQQLGALVQQVRNSAGSIQLASNEVASGNSDLSGRTEQAASQLQTTASAMQQLTQNVGQSAEAAHHASGLVGSASQVAERGGAVVSQVVSTMDEINHASRKIGDIIGTIDAIAFQTNILALNAAVEAARAGEAGRGFAVVASEVRALAQRSATAAREIKSLISASVDKVDNGARLVQDAGSTMGEIVASVQRVADIIREISTATSEQNQGIGEINSAVSQLDGMTQQNAALVEQSAAAAESLKDQASRLNSVVARFQLQS